jgi:hypothetical protein
MEGLLMNKLPDYEIEWRDQLKKLAEKRTGKKLQIIDHSFINYQNKGYEIGKTYYLGNWGEFNTCLNIANGWVYVEREDGRQRAHMTRIDPSRDFIVVEA